MKKELSLDDEWLLSAVLIWVLNDKTRPAPETVAFSAAEQPTGEYRIATTSPRQRLGQQL